MQNVNDNKNNIPVVFSPFGGTSDMEHIHTTIHTPEATSKTNSVQKDKIKHTLKHLRYPNPSENTKIQFTPVDRCGQDKNFTVLMCHFLNWCLLIFKLNHYAHTEPC